MSALVDIPSITSAVEHMLELADRMRSDFGFGDTDVVNIDKVIEALHELENLRHDAHQRLEAETIQASIKRHKLQFLPQQITQEISDAVTSARQSNADALAFLKKKLDGINKNIVYLEDYQKKLDEENAILHPERELIRQQHEEIISQLNQRMAEKASMQIHLNETRDKVRQTNQEIVDLEDGILQLKEDLIHERSEARNEKRQLKKAVASTSEKTKEQRIYNIEKKNELDRLHEKLVDSEGKLDTLRKSLRRYETSKAKLEGQERALSAQLQKQLKQNEELRRKGASIVNEDVKLQQEFTENEKQLSKKLKRLENEIERETSRFDELDQKKTDYAEELEKMMTVREEDAERVADLDEQLQAEKRQLAMKAEEVGRMQGENTDMAEQIETLGESHKAVVAQLNKLVEDYRQQLAKERKERLDVQKRKNSVSKELEDFKLDNQKFMQEMNKTITTGKTEHVDLSNEGAQLQRELREDENEIKGLEEKLHEEQKVYQDNFTKRQNEVESMEKEIINMEHSIADKSQRIEDLTPGFEELEKQFDARTAAYEAQKKSMVELKGKKTQLEEQIRKAKAQKENLAEPQTKLRQELKQKRHEALFQLKHQGEDTRHIEQEIFLSGSKLKTVLDENAKFEEACSQLNKDIDDLQNEMDHNQLLKARLLEEIVKTKEGLEKSWNDDRRIQQEFTDRDQEVVNELGLLLERTGRREQKISEITSQLEVELASLTSFLDNLASRRPKDSYMSQCRTPTPDSRESRRPLSIESRLSRASSRSQALLEANRALASRVQTPRSTRSARSMRSVVIADQVMEIQSDKSISRSATKLLD